MDESLGFLEWLRRCRGALGLTQQVFAAQLGYAITSYRKLEIGERQPSRPFIDHLADFLNVSDLDRATLYSFASTGICEQPLALLQRVLADRQPMEALDQATNCDQIPSHIPMPELPTLRYQLRASIADFVGRTAELQHLRATLQTAPDNPGAIICGVRGMGGIGKTELAYRVAHDLRSTFPDAQIVLHLGGVSASPLTPEQALAQVIRVFTPAATLPNDLPTLEALYRAQLHAKHVLILADDARDAAQVRALLPPSGSALLITSRQRFSLPGMTTLDLEQLALEQASTLLQQLCPRLSAGEATALASAYSCLPLAVRVSGCLLHNDPALSATDYLLRLADDRSRLAALRDPDDPLLDVAATLTLSYDLLGTPVQAVFRQLGVVVAGFSTEMAQAVVEIETSADVIDVLRRNLLQYDSAHRRWRLHDLVRDLARQRLEAMGEVEAA